MDSRVTPLSPQSNPHTKVLLVMDVAESVRLMEDDERDAVQRWQALVTHVVQQVLPETGGRMVKSLGDGLMLEFGHVRSCVEAAFAIQRFSRNANQGIAPARQMHLRMGAHIAGFVSDEHDIYGADVNLAVRLTSLTRPGDLVVSVEFRERLVAHLDAEIEDLGDCFLKHISKPVRAFRVSPPESQPEHAVPSAVRVELRPTLAVVPFGVQSTTPGHELLGEALADEAIAAFSRHGALRVISRLSSTAFGQQQHPLAEIRAHLGADYVLAGACRCFGSQVVLYAELVDTRSGELLWADNLRGTLADLFAGDSDVMPTLVARTCAAIMTGQVQRARRQSISTLENYTLLLGGISLMHRLSHDDFERARAMLTALVERAPREAVPRAWLAHWHALRVSQGWTDNPGEDAMLALDQTKRALDEDPDCALALTVNGVVHANLFKQLDVAALRYDQALQINPNESYAWLTSGTLHAFRGDGERAVEHTETALALSPLDPLRYLYDSLAATAAMSAGRYERAVELATRSLRANRTHTSTLRALAVSQHRLGLQVEARRTARDIRRLDPAFTVSGFLARTPSSDSDLGPLCAESFREIGIPE